MYQAPQGLLFARPNSLKKITGRFFAKFVKLR